MESSTGTPLIRPVKLSDERPAESSGDIDHWVTVPPVDNGTRSKSVELRSKSMSLGTYSTTGKFVRMVMLMNAVEIPPVLVALIVYIVRGSSSVGVPLITPVEVSNARPAGRLGLMDQVTNSPDPVMVGEIGRSLLAVLLVNVKSLGTYSKVGTWSTIVMLMYAV